MGYTTGYIQTLVSMLRDCPILHILFKINRFAERVYLPVTVNGIVASNMVLTQSTNGTLRIAARNSSGHWLITAPIKSPPADAPEIAKRSGQVYPRSIRPLAACMKSLKVFFLNCIFPSSYHGLMTINYDDNVLPSIFSASSNVCNSIHKSSIKQADRVIIKSRIITDAI